MYVEDIEKLEERIIKYQVIMQAIDELAVELLDIPHLNTNTRKVALALRVATAIAATI